MESPIETKEPFRNLFMRLLESLRGEYISNESATKLKLLEDKSFENELKSEQISRKNVNLLYSRNFAILADALKSVFESTVLERHALQLKKLFGLTDIQELRGGVMANFITYFINQKLHLRMLHLERHERRVFKGFGGKKKACSDVLFH